jgi:anti-anti-sigma factor
LPDPEAFGSSGILRGSLSDHGDEIVYSLAGEIDLSVADELAARIAELLRLGPRTLVLDLGRLTFLDSSGCRALLTASREATGRGRRLVLRNVGGSPRRVLEMTGIGEALDVEDEPGLS